MSVPLVVYVDRAFHTKVHISSRVKQFQKFTIRNGGAAMQIHNLKRMVDRGVQLTAHSKRFRQVRSFHNRRDPALPGDIGSHDVNDAT